jgi:hypothetical protein
MTQRRAAALLAGAPVLGIDCEWQPAMREGQSQSATPVAILQVSAAASQRHSAYHNQHSDQHGRAVPCC